MAQIVIMPKEGITVEFCLVGSWSKNVGDPVQANEVLFEYETDKAAFACVSTASGVLLHKFYNQGDEAAVLSPVAIIGEAGEDVSDLIKGAGAAGAGAAEEAAGAAGDAAAAGGGDEAGASDGGVPEDSPPPMASPRARALAAEHGVDLSTVTPTGPGGRILESDVIGAASKAEPGAGDTYEAPGIGDAYEAPGAEDLYEASGVGEEETGGGEEAGVEEAGGVGGEETGGEETGGEGGEEEIDDGGGEEVIDGSDIGEDIGEEESGDEEAGGDDEAGEEEESGDEEGGAEEDGEGEAAEAGPAAEDEPDAGPEAAPAPAMAEQAQAPVPVAYVDEPFSKIRSVIARTMVSSLERSAQLTHHHSFDATAVLAMREDFKASGDALGYGGVSVGDIILYVTSRLLAKHPEINALVADEGVRKYNIVNLGVAVDTPRGLIVPTVFSADKKTLKGISSEVKALAAGVREGGVSPDFLKGGTFTVSNLGATGVEVFTPIINPPQAAILGVCGVVERVRKGRDGGIEVYPSIGLSLTYDHRAVDGAPASRFVAELCDALASFSWKTLAIELEGGSN